MVNSQKKHPYENRSEAKDKASMRRKNSALKFAYLILGSLIFVRGLMWVTDLVKAENFLAAGTLAVLSFGIWLFAVVQSRRLHLRQMQMNQLRRESVNETKEDRENEIN